ncbi:OLC1v1006652C1 [Oldenlandia corymbosa var. corymbosa]|uniref:OLC1v1006652C1 n=1 Tax=Oldenlandia corymbosa var. corymbosa TaxID=529605 RepID=A0AAV1DJ05_OLDCO|nr:OLC1v1006652C1 [Oldenlandia corymbosa var. corymbosa]
MATSTLQLPSSVLILFLLTAPLLVSSASSSLKCTSQKFTGAGIAQYSECADLPALNSFLHWSYNHSDSTVSVAFAAPPAKPNGWVAWALNPTGTGMAGAQALLAYKTTNGSLVVKTYNITSYASIVESKLSFDVLNKKAEFSNGVMTIYATLALPASLTEVNHIWQVGSSVSSDGVPAKHDFAPANLNAKGKVEFVRQSKAAGSPAPAPAMSPGPAAGGPTGAGKNGSSNGVASSTSMRSLALFGLFILFGNLIYGF